MTLYILGNGFDLAHDLNTSYAHYRKFIKDNLKQNYKWDIILDYYPEEYAFWSDIEYNVCNINKAHYLSLKHLFSFGLLDELLRQIHISFEKFILKRESAIFSLKPRFEFDKGAYFFSFNYTTVLEDVYKIDRKKITYIHNDISGPALEIMYNIQNHTPCIIGHSCLENNYAFHSDLLEDKEYRDFIKNTTKESEIILKQSGVDRFLKDNRNNIDKVVFYGFSFSITDKAYAKAIFDALDDGKTAIFVYYKVLGNKNKEECLSQFKKRLCDCSIDIKNVIFVDCDTTNKI